jgi:mRNA interferase MazF
MSAPVHRGDRVWASKDPAVGREQAGDRPWLVLSHDAQHQGTQVAIVVPMTHTDRSWITHVRMNPGASGTPDIAICEQVQSMSLQRIRRVDAAPYGQDLVNQVHQVVTMLTGPR